MLLLLLALPLYASAHAGKIEKLGGASSVAAVRDGTSVKLKVGDTLNEGDSLATSDSVSLDLRLEDDTLIRLGSNTVFNTVRYPKEPGRLHQLSRGTVRILVTPFERKQEKLKFRLHTPHAVLAVKGTEFTVEVTDCKTELRGLDGVVLFGSDSYNLEEKEKLVEVRRGFWSLVGPCGGGPLPVKPEKFELVSYIDLINARSGPFGPLAGRQGEHASRTRSTQGSHYCQVTAVKRLKGHMVPLEPTFEFFEGGTTLAEQLANAERACTGFAKARAEKECADPLVEGAGAKAVFEPKGKGKKEYEVLLDCAELKKGP